jgi:hypothetical protein
MKKAAMENETSENTRRSFNHTKSEDEERFVETSRNKVVTSVNPITIFFVPILKIELYYKCF